MKPIRYFEKNTITLIVGCVFSIFCGVIQATENNPGAGVSTHVNKISLSQVGAPQVLKVTAKGAEYDTLDTNTLSVNYSASTECKGLWDIHYFDVALGSGGDWYSIKGKNVQHLPIGIYEDTLSNWGVDSGKKSMSFHNRTLTGPLHAELKKAAINQCNSEAAKAAQQQNISLAKAMSTKRQLTLQSNWMNSNLRMYAWVSCGKPQDTLTWLSVYDGVPDIKVECESKPYFEGVNTGTLPNQINSQFQVTNLVLKSDTSTYTGQCPKEVVLTGEISANRAGTVEYQWNSGMTMSAPKKLTFTKAEKRFVTRKFAIEHSQQTVYKLTTKGLGKTESNSVQVNVNCISAPSAHGTNLAPKLPSARPVPTPVQSDLTPNKTLTIGTATGFWGGVLMVDASKMNSEKRGDACKMRMLYEVLNIGQGDAGGFNSRLFETSTTLHSEHVSSLKAANSQKVAGNIFLNDGVHNIGVSVDDQKMVSESNEGNNMNRIQVKVTGCSDPSPQPRPSAPRQ